MKLLALLTLLFFSVTSFAREVCIDQSRQLKFVFERNTQFYNKLVSVTFSKDNKLVFTDYGRKPFGFLRMQCHVYGSPIIGEFIRLGSGCSVDNDENNPNLITIRATGEQYDLSDFECSLEN